MRINAARRGLRIWGKIADDSSQYSKQRLPATERRARETYARSAQPLIHEEELPMKTYSKPTLKKHASLKQITFSSH